MEREQVLTPSRQGGAVLEGDPLGERVAELRRGALAPATLRAYRSDARIWSAWCEGQGLDPLAASPEVLNRFLAHQADKGGPGGCPLKVATLRRRLAAIRMLYAAAGKVSPTASVDVAAVMRGIARERGTAPRQKDALEASAIKRLLGALPRDEAGELTLQGRRDRALLLVGFAGAFRRSELVALDVEDLTWEPEGVRIRVRRSKTDPDGQGRVKPLHRGTTHCPVDAVQAWIAAAGLESGPLFRSLRRGGHVTGSRLSPAAVARTVQRLARATGVVGDFAGHSLRAGFVTTARRAGAELEDVMAVTHHRSVQTVQGYFRAADAFRSDPLAGLL